MPGNTPAFSTATLSGGKVRLDGFTPLPNDVICTNVTIIHHDRYVQNTRERSATGAAWHVEFTSPTDPQWKLEDGDELFVVGTLVRKKAEDEDCDCPEPDNVVWDQYMTIEPGDVP